MDVDALFAPGGYAHNFVRHVAHQMIDRAGLTLQDLPDLTQELTLRVLAGLSAYDPTRGNPEAFVTTLARRAAAAILRERRVAKRAGGWTVPNDPWPRIDPRPDTTADLRIDLAALVADLPPKLRATADAIIRAATITEAASQVGRSRAAMYGRVVALRKRFEQAGLRDYLGNEPDTLRAFRQRSR